MIVGLPLGDRGDGESGERRAVAQQRERAVAANGPAPFDRRVPGGRGLVARERRQRALDAGLDRARLGAHHENRAFGRDQLFRRASAGGDVDKDRRLAGIGGRIDPGVEARACRRGRAAAPVERGREARVTLGSRDDRGAEREDEGAETQRARIAPGHARRGRGGRDPGDLPGEAAPVEDP